MSHVTPVLNSIQVKKVCDTKSSMSMGFIHTDCRKLQSSNPEITKPAADVKLTERCIKQLRRVTSDDGSMLRISVEGGGCSGFQYKFELVDNKVNEDDQVFGEHDAPVVIDNDTLDYLTGCTIDYESEMIRSAFVVQANPQADAKCSCGVSFSLKL